MQVTIDAIAEIERYNQNITIILNKAKTGDIERAETVLREFYPYPIFEVKYSTAFVQAVKQKKSMQQLVDEWPLFSFHYSKPLAQLRAIIERISQPYTVTA